MTVVVPVPVPVRPITGPRLPVLCITLNIHGPGVELREVRPDQLWGRFAYGRYGENVGNGRLLDCFARRGLKATVFVPGADGDMRLVERLLRDGHEVALHGNDFEDHGAMADGEEKELIGRASEALQRLTGSAPRGWRAPFGKLSARTLGHLGRLGFAYDSSFQDDDVPYGLDDDGGIGMIEIPQSEMLIDATLWNTRQTHARVLTSWVEEFDAASEAACLMTLTLHNRADYGSARASRVAVLDAFLDHVQSHQEVEILTCAEILGRVRAGTLACRNAA